MLQWDWFGEDEEDDLSDDQRAFLRVLRSRTETWPCGPEETQLVEPEDDCPRWRAVLDVTSEVEPLILFTVGVCFDGTSIWAGEVDSGGYYPCSAAKSRVEVIEAVGSPEDLASLAADWFERFRPDPLSGANGCATAGPPTGMPSPTPVSAFHAAATCMGFRPIEWFTPAACRPAQLAESAVRDAAGQPNSAV